MVVENGRISTYRNEPFPAGSGGGGGGNNGSPTTSGGSGGGDSGHPDGIDSILQQMDGVMKEEVL